MAPEDVAFSSVTQLAPQVRSRKVSPVELTQLYLNRIKRLDPQLLAVITLTEELALREARQAEREIASGHYRGPLHGIPYGVKDLLDTKGIRTTWGIKHHENRVPVEDATVVTKLRQAGAVLIAKLTMGELARGARWYGGTTRCPWDTTRSSGGSSAGPGAATAAGAVGFSIGSETFGSLLGPSAACGVTGLRPTYGRVSRAGAMALSWSIDKLGPMCRSVEDCMTVFEAIRGSDPRDLCAIDMPHQWDPSVPIDNLRVGVVEQEFQALGGEKETVMSQALKDIEKLGVRLKPIRLPDYPYQEVFQMVRGAEAAVFFEDLILEDHLDSLSDDAPRAWKNLLPIARLTPAVHYLKAQQLRTLMQADANRLMQEVDVWLAPAGGPARLVERPRPESPAARPSAPPRAPAKTLPLTNLTGQPAICVTAGFVGGLPVGIQFVGRNFDEATPCRLALAYQEATGWHQHHPNL